MKSPRSLLLYVFIASAYSTSTAQTIEFTFQPQNITINGKVIQYDYSTDIPPVVFQKQLTYGYNVGLMIGIEAGKKFAVNIGLLYANDKQNFKDESRNGSIYFDSTTYFYNHTYTTSLALNYLNIPIQLTYESSIGKKLSFICSGGICFSKLLDYTIQTRQNHYDQEVHNAQSVYYSNTKSTSASDGSINITSTYAQNPVYFMHSETYALKKEPFYKSDFKLTGGAGIEYKISAKLSFPILFTYELGLLNIKNPHSYYQLPYRPYGAYTNDVPLWENSDPLKVSAMGLTIGVKLKVWHSNHGIPKEK